MPRSPEGARRHAQRYKLEHIPTGVALPVRSPRRRRIPGNRINATPAHPLVAKLADVMEARGNGRYATAKAAGLARSTVRMWLHSGAIPGVSAFEDALNAVGHRLRVRQVGRPAESLIRKQHSWSAVGNPDAHWLVQFARFQADRFGVSMKRTVEAAGVKWSVARAWWRIAQLNMPSLPAIAAVLEVLGFTLEIAPLAAPRGA